jgi:predicted phage terminase large subunit-like protein
VTTNPDPDSWVKKYLAPWVDDTFTDWATSGEVRWFYRDGDSILWLHSPDERPKHVPRDEVHSVTFIEAHLEDNPALMESDPGYRGRIQAMPRLERVILSGGPEAWKVRLDGNMFKREWFEIVDAAPTEFTSVIRRWDLAATELRKGKLDPDWTCGVKMGRAAAGVYYVLDAIFLRSTPGEVKRVVKQTAMLDGYEVKIRVPQDPGQAGKAQAQDFVRDLDGWDVAGVIESGDKVTRAKPFSAQCEAGNVKLVRGPWVEQWLNQITAFPNTAVHDDAVDASDGAYEQLRERGRIPLADEPEPGASEAEQSLIEAIREAQRDPFKWADLHELW